MESVLVQRVNYQCLESDGFTLVELLVVLAIMGILMAVAGPSLISMIERNRVTENVNKLVSSLQSARSEAIKRQGVVQIDNANGVSKDWSDGWSIEDSNATAPFISTIRVISGSDDVVNINGNASAEGSVGFTPNGRLDDVSAAVFHVCSNNKADRGRRVTVDRGGRSIVDDIPAAGSCTP